LTTRDGLVLAATHPAAERELDALDLDRESQAGDALTLALEGRGWSNERAGLRSGGWPGQT
ncbi:MAG: hypothetical protein ABIY48_04690, partial [Acidimicrobiales bacterium]